MAFARAARFPVRVPGRDFSTPGPGTYSARASCGLPRVLAHTFGQPSRAKPRPLPKAKAVAIVNDAQRQRTTQLDCGGTTPRLQQDEALPSVDVAQLALTAQLGRGGLGTVVTGVFSGKAIAVKYYLTAMALPRKTPVTPPIEPGGGSPGVAYRGNAPKSNRPSECGHRFVSRS